MPTRLCLFSWVILLLTGSLSFAAPGPGKPNIVWIVGENLDLDLGCYGEHVRTPNLDRLAAEGVRYTNVFATSPVCAPSRSAFMTGMYQTSTDTQNMRSHRDDDFRLPPGVRPTDPPASGCGLLHRQHHSIGDRVVGTGKLDLNFVNEGPIYQSDDWSALKSHQPFFARSTCPRRSTTSTTGSPGRNPASSGSEKIGIPESPLPGTSLHHLTIPITRSFVKNGPATSTLSPAWMSASAGSSINWSKRGWTRTPSSCSSGTTAGWRLAASTGARIRGCASR